MCTRVEDLDKVLRVKHPEDKENKQEISRWRRLKKFLTPEFLRQHKEQKRADATSEVCIGLERDCNMAAQPQQLQTEMDLHLQTASRALNMVETIQAKHQKEVEDIRAQNAKQQRDHEAHVKDLDDQVLDLEAQVKELKIQVQEENNTCLKLQREISRLEKDREDMVAKYQDSDPMRDGKQVDALQREKAQLHLRLKSLEAEVVELHAQRRNSAKQAESIQRTQIRQLMETQAVANSLEAERQSLHLQLELMESEFQSTNEQNSQLTVRLHKAETEVNSLNSQIQSLAASSCCKCESATRAERSLQNLESGIGRSATMLGLSAGLGGTEMELQKLLIDEKMKSESHHNNYQTLKAEHIRLEEEFVRTQGELKRQQGDRQVEHENVKLLLAELRGELLDKTRELEEVRMQVMTPQRLELLRAQVQEEMEVPVRERFNKLEEEAEKYRTEYNKIRYDFILFKSQLEHQTQEHARVLEEKKMRYDAEISRLEKDWEDMVAKYQDSDPMRDGKQVEALLREKAQLNLRLKSLEAEVVELHAQRRNSGQQAESTQRTQIRQLTETQAVVKSLEAERQSLRLQLERMESEFQSTNEQNSQLTVRLHKAETEVNSLNSQLESLKHSHKLEVAQIKLDCTRSKGELEREKDALQGQLDVIQMDVEILNTAVGRHKDALVEKEREMVRKVQSAREEVLGKIAVLLEEKLELEKRIADLERQRLLQDAEGNSQKEEWEERVHDAKQREESARRELQDIRVKLQRQSLELEELERQKEQISDLQQQNQELGVQLGSLSHSECELKETNQRLKQSLDRVREELTTARRQAERSQQEKERMVEDRQVEWLEEKRKLQDQEAELQQKYTQAKEKLQRAAEAQKERKTLTENKEKRLKEKIQLLEAKVEELELEAAVAKKRSSVSEEHTQLSRQLKELQRRHNEFRHLLREGQGPFNASPALRTSTPSPFLLGCEEQMSNITEEHQKELSLLHQRMENLESVQQQQLEELGSLMHKDRDTPQPDH